MKQVKLQMQPIGSNTCGQHCVAMLAGISVDEVLKVAHKRGRTRTKDIADIMRAVGLRPKSDRLVRVKEIVEVPETCLLKLKYNATDKFFHWVVKSGDTIYDPAHGEYPFALEIPQLNARIRSYLETKH